MSAFFEVLDSVLVNDKDLFETHEKNIVPFQLNRALSMNLDTVLYANEMNKRHWLHKELQYDYLRHSVRKGKRFNKWAKNKTDKYLAPVVEYYECSKAKALDIIRTLNEDQLDEIVKKCSKGGRQ